MGDEIKPLEEDVKAYHERVKNADSAAAGPKSSKQRKIAQLLKQQQRRIKKLQK